VGGQRDDDSKVGGDGRRGESRRATPGAWGRREGGGGSRRLTVGKRVGESSEVTAEGGKLVTGGDSRRATRRREEAVGVRGG
jgi:hypothetical protein